MTIIKQFVGSFYLFAIVVVEGMTKYIQSENFM